MARLLGAESDGSLPIEESAAIDFKEEAGRRRGSALDPGVSENPEAATKLADEVACLANSPGGGALILGVVDKTGEIIGTELDIDWLRHRIYRAVDVAPDIQEHRVAGQRLLALYVAASREPVEDTSGRLRWRVGSTCSPVDRAEWWQHRSVAQGFDPMAVETSARREDVGRGTLVLIRQQLDPEASASDVDLLRQIGALRSDGLLSQAAKLLLTAAGRPLIELTVLDVHGGSVLNRIEPPGHLSLLEQIDSIERALELVNDVVARSEGFAAQPVRRVPQTAVREAVLNGLIHRDWNRADPTDIRWVDFDSTLIVRSPGGFEGGINAQNVLSNRYARYPALADLFRALHFVEKQGLGVDRMYQAMITLGHRPPIISEEVGPSIVCELVGGTPVLTIVELVRGIRPAERQRDARIAILLHVLLHEPFLTVESAASALQADIRSAGTAIHAAAQSTFVGEPIIRPYKGCWLLGKAAREVARAAQEAPSLSFVPYATTDAAVLGAVAHGWVERHGSVTTGDLMELSGVSRGTAQRVLGDMAGTDFVQTGAGRSSRFERPLGESRTTSTKPFTG